MKLQIENLGKVAITVDNNYWNINKDYDRLVIVEVKDKFSTYLSRKPVPAGTQITNREYWIPFSSLKEEILIDYNKFINKYKDQLDYYKESIDKFKEESDNLNKLNKIILTNKEDIDYIKKLINYYHDDGECVYDTYSFIIDQRGIISDPEDMVINLSNEPKDVPGCIGKPATNFMSWLKANTHAYVGRYTGFSGIRLKQLDDTTRKRFADGTSSINYISNESGEFDVWMKINSDVYIKTEPWIPIGASVPNPDYVLVTIARELPAGEDETKWEKFSQYNLYGVYEACRINNRLHSLSGKRSVNNISQTQSKSQARARGNGFKIVDYKFSKLIAFLFYGYYSTLDSQTQLGYGTVNLVNRVCYPKITGQTDDLAGVDTNSVTGNGAVTPDNDQIIAGEGSDIKSNNFWHLENIQGDLTECLDDMMVMQAKRPSSVTSSNPIIYLSDYVSVYGYPIITKSGKDYQLTSELLEAMNENQRFITISDIRGNIIRIIQHGDFTGNSEGSIKKMCFGDHADIIVKEFGASYNTGFCDYGYVHSAGYIARRSGDSVYPDGGVGCLHLYSAAGSASSYVGSRLLYEGSEETIHIIDDATESL